MIERVPEFLRIPLQYCSVSFRSKYKELPMGRRMNRRQFLQAGSASAAAAGFWLTGGVTETRAAQGANDRLNVAMIGAGGRADGNEGGIRGQNIVALCDV